MNNDKSQGGRGEVLSMLTSPDEIRKSIHTSNDRASVRSSQYDQVSSGDILRRFREQGTQRKQSTVTNAAETAQEAALKAEVPRSEDYVIEVPKSGMQDKDEYVIPLFLPTVCSSIESEHTINEEEVSEEHKKSTAKPIRTLVYCEDDVVFAEYLEEHNLQGATKPLWGLQFDSKFESGNLYKAESVQHRGAPLGAPEEYDLTMRPDVYNSHADTLSTNPSLTWGSQWFFFRVQNTKKRTYRFHLGPFSHDVPALRRGMLPAMISEEAYKHNGVGWQRVGHNVVFEKNKQGSYTLSFSFHNATPKDILYFAFAPPYTYTQLQNMLYTLAKDAEVRQHFSVRPLCRTLAGNRCDVVTISENITPKPTPPPVDSDPGNSKARPSNPRASAVNRAAAGKAPSSAAGSITASNTPPVETVEEEEAVVPDFLLKMQRLIQTEKHAKDVKQAEDSRKKVVFITARVHGGETVSSWMCEGVIKFLLGGSPTAVELRKAVVFHIVPMLNPDGVVNGHSKRDIGGCDLNEHWDAPSPMLHPTVYHTKQLVKQSLLTGTLLAFFDLHGQATKDGMVLYSVMPTPTEMQLYYQQVSKFHHEKKDPNVPVSGVLDITKQADPRTYKLAAARRSPLVNLKCCAVKAGANKAGSARVVAAHEFHFPISMTVEASCHLSLVHKQYLAKQLVSTDYARFGCILLIALADVMGMSAGAVDAIKTEKLTRVRRASLAVSALSKFGSIRNGDDAIAGALAQVRLADANNSLGSDSDSSSVPFVSTSGPRQRPQKKDSFAIGSSARYTSGPSRNSVELRQQEQDESGGTEVNSAQAVPKSSFAQVGEHTHYFSEEEVDPADIKVPNLQLHFDEDIWETKSDTSDMEDPNPKIRPPTAQAGRVAVSVAPPLNEKIAWNLRRADELGLLEGTNHSGITMTMGQLAAHQRATFRDRVPKQAPAEASFEAKSVVHTAGPNHPHAGPAPPSVSDDGGNVAKTPTRVVRKHIINPERMQSAIVAAAQPPSPTPEAVPGLQLVAVTTAATPTAADSPRVNSPALLETSVAVQQGTVRQQSFSSHAPKKGVIKVNLTRDPSATAAQGGLAGKSLGETKGQVSFTVHVHETGSSKFSQAPVSPVLKVTVVPKTEDADEKMGFDSDNDETDPTEVAYSEHMSVLANHVSRKVLTNDHHSAKKQVANTSAKISASRKIKSDLASKIIEVPRSYSESAGDGDESAQSVEQDVHGRSESVSPQHSEQPVMAAAMDPLVSAVSYAMDVITGTLPDTLAVAVDSGLGRSSSPLPFSPTTPLPVQGIDPLNNSMSPVFSLYTDTAPFYSERVSERIQQQQQQQQEQEQEIEQAHLCASSRVNTASRQPQRRLSTPLNTQTVSSAGYVRSATPPRSARSRHSGDGQSEKAAVITLPHVRSTTNEEVAHPHNAAIVFDDVLGDEPGPVSLKRQHYVPYLNLSNSATLSVHSGPVQTTRKKQMQPSAPSQQRTLRIAVPPIDTKHIDTKPIETKLSAQEREREAMQAKFLHDMGLDYNRLFGPGGIMRAPAERKKNIKLHRSQEAAPLMAANDIAGADGLFSSAFPLRHAVYEKDVVELRPAEATVSPVCAGEMAPVLVRQGHKGVAGIRAPQQDRVYLRHQLDQFYKHVEDSLRERQLVEESAMAITATKVFEMVHQINLLDERELARMELQDTIRRNWLARGGKLKHKSKHRPNKQPQPDSTADETDEAPDTIGRMTPITPRTYGALRNSLKSHGSAEGSILQDYQEYIGGADGDEGSHWQWLTAASPFPVAPSKSPTNGNGKDNISIPSAQATGDRGNRDDVDTPQLGEAGGAIGDGKAPSVIFHIDATVKAKKKAVQIVQAHLGIDLGQESKASRVSTKAGGMDVFLDATDGACYTNSQDLQDTMYQSVLDSISEAQRQGNQPKLKGFYHNGLYYRYPQGPAQHSPRRLCSPPRARLDFFGGRGTHIIDNVQTSSGTHDHQNTSGDTHAHGDGADHKVGLDVVKPHRKLVDVTVVPTLTTEDSQLDLNCASGDMEFEDDLDEAPGIAVSAGPEVHHAHSQTAEPAHDPALPMHRIDSEYARYLRHGEIYRRSIIAGVDHEQPASLHASGHTLPSALTAPEAVASLKSNPLLQQRLNAISAARQRQEQRAAFDLDGGDSVELLARTIRQTIGVQNLQLEASVRRGVAVEPKTITPRRQLKEKRSVDTPVSIVIKDNTGPFSVVPKVLSNAAPALHKDSPQRSPRRPAQPVPSSPSFTANIEARYVLG